MCVPGECVPGSVDCNMDPMDGCEAQLATDFFNCGMCGNTCNSPDLCQGGNCCRTPPMGTYESSCMGCTACNGVLSCMCRDAAQNYQPTTIQLSPPCPGGYTNCNGVLLCNAC
jgi:hypothetical protein